MAPLAAAMFVTGAVTPEAMAQEALFQPDPTRGTAQSRESFTEYPAPLDNPDMTGGCRGLDIDMVFDVSGSMSNRDVNDAVAASKDFVAKLINIDSTGTSTIGVNTFAEESPASQNPDNLPRTPISDVDTINTHLDKVNSTSGLLGGEKTNYEAAFKVIQDPGDMVIFITDGANTKNDAGRTDGLFGRGNHLISGKPELDSPYVREANRIKEAGTKIIGIMSGARNYDPADTVVDHMTFISGQNAVLGEDYFNIDDFTQLSDALGDIIEGECAADETVTVSDITKSSDTCDAVSVPMSGSENADWSKATYPTTGQPTGAAASNGGKTLTVEGEGVWTFSGGNAVFTPAEGFDCSTNPSPVKYTTTDADGTAAEAPATATVSYDLAEAPPVVNDVTETSNTCVAVPVEMDGSDNIDWSTATFPSEGQPEGATVSEDGKTLTMEGQGVWTFDGQNIVFTPEEGFDCTTDPTPVLYSATDSDGNAVLEPANATVSYDLTDPTSPTTGPTSPTTGPTSPTTGPTSPTTGPTSPTTGPTSPVSSNTSQPTAPVTNSPAPPVQQNPSPSDDGFTPVGPVSGPKVDTGGTVVDETFWDIVKRLF